MCIGTLIKINLNRTYSWLKASISTILHDGKLVFFTGFYPCNKHIILKHLKKKEISFRFYYDKEK